MNLRSFFIVIALAITAIVDLKAQERIPVTLEQHRLTANILSP
ncbi:MAG: hypothetical protein AAFO69_12865 [Bacteroidota bacterium]